MPDPHLPVSSPQVQIGVSLPLPGLNAAPALPLLLEVARQLEQTGVHVLVLRLPDGPLRTDPLVLTGALLAATRHLAVVAEVDALEQVPFHLARRLASLDHLSGGRVGAQLRLPAPPTAGALRQVMELTRVLRGLWDSYADDAPLRDQVGGLYYWAAGRQALDHRGEFYQVAGPLNLSRPPQGHPALFLNLVHPAQLALAAQIGDVLLTPGDGTLPGQLQDALRQLGRDPYSAASWRTVRPVLASSAGEAERAFGEQLAGLTDADLTALLGRAASLADLSPAHLDRPVAPAILRAPQWWSLSPAGPLTYRALARQVSRRQHIVGTPATLAEHLVSGLPPATQGALLHLPDWDMRAVAWLGEALRLLRELQHVAPAQPGQTLRGRLNLTRPAGRPTWGGVA